jgi:hypothetical protein
VIANLQANTVYWRECDQKQSQENEEAADSSAAIGTLPVSSTSGGSSSHLLPRTKSIVEDNEIDIE